MRLREMNQYIWCLLAPNFLAVDSIVYYPNEVITCIQITINVNTLLLSPVSSVFKDGSNFIHHLQISALKTTAMAFQKKISFLKSIPVCALGTEPYVAL